ncbi:MAG: VanZ family protein [Burkholderiaceae bacterium]
MGRPPPSTAWPLALLYGALIVYASLFPFTGWRDQGIAPWAYLHAPWPRYWTKFDLAINLLGYLPMGFLLALALRRTCARWPAALLAGLATAALSFTLECLQSWLPLRVASNVDLGFNALGGLLGAVGAAALDRLGAIDRWQRMRSRWFARDARGALVLLALWPIGLLFPLPVAFGMGQVYERSEDALGEWLQGTPFLDWLPVRDIELQPMLPLAEAACVALGALAPCLLGYCVIGQRGRRAVFAAAALAAGIAVSALSAALSFGPANAWAWVTPSVQRGLPLAALAAVVLIGLPVRACAGALLAAVLAQLALLNSATPNVYFAATLQSWEQGRFIHFYGLAQWLGWLWPFAVLAWLLARALAHAPVPKIKP